MWYGKHEKRSNFTMKHLGNITSARWPRSTSAVISHADGISYWYNVMKMVLYFWFFFPLLIHDSSLIMRKISSISQLRDILLQNTLLLKTSQFIKNKERLKTPDNQRRLRKNVDTNLCDVLDRKLEQRNQKGTKQRLRKRESNMDVSYSNILILVHCL